jgi:hypothetical protein
MLGSSNFNRFAYWSQKNHSNNIGLVLPTPPAPALPWSASSSNGLRRNNVSGATQGIGIATMGKSYGKWYWEYNVLSIPSSASHSTDGLISNISLPLVAPNASDRSVLGHINNSIGILCGALGYVSNIGSVITHHNISSFNYFLVGCALDLTPNAEKLRLYGNNNLIATIALTTSTWFPAAATWAIAENTNFGQFPFSYSVPAGFAPGVFNPYYTKLDNNKTYTNTSTTNKSYITSDKLRYVSGQYDSYCMPLLGKSSGKWYWEVTIKDGSSATNSFAIGVSTATHSGAVGLDPNSWVYITHYNAFGSNTFRFNSGAPSPYIGTSALAIGDTWGVALDMDAGKVYLYKNGTSSSTPLYSGLTGTLYPIVGAYLPIGTCSYTINFGATAFVNPPPIGYNYGLYT